MLHESIFVFHISSYERSTRSVRTYVSVVCFDFEDCIHAKFISKSDGTFM